MPSVLCAQAKGGGHSTYRRDEINSLDSNQPSSPFLSSRPLKWPGQNIAGTTRGTTAATDFPCDRGHTTESLKEKADDICTVWKANKEIKHKNSHSFLGAPNTKCDTRQPEAHRCVRKGGVALSVSGHSAYLTLPLGPLWHFFGANTSKES